MMHGPRSPCPAAPWRAAGSLPVARGGPARRYTPEVLAILLGVAALAGPVPYGWNPVVRVPTPEISARDEADAARVDALPHRTLEQRVEKLLATRDLSDGALLALYDREAWTVAEVVSPYGRAAADYLALLSEDERAAVLAGVRLVRLRDAWSQAEAAWVEAHPILRETSRVPEAVHVFAAGRNAVGVYLGHARGPWAGNQVAMRRIYTPLFARQARRLVEERYGLRPARVTYEQWQAVETAHLVVRHAPETTRDTRAVADTYEGALQRICEELAIEPPGERITVWSYESRRHQRSLWHHGANQALPDVLEVHMKADATPGHEIAHVLTRRAWGPPSAVVLDEGLAVHVNQSWDAVPWARRLPHRVRLDPLIDGFRQLGEARAYLQGAALVAWILEVHGLDALKTAWQAEEPRAGIATATGLAWEEVEPAWRDWLRRSADRSARSDGPSAR